MFKFSKIVSAVALAVAGVAANAGVIIDDFEVPAAGPKIEASGGGSNAVTQASGTILGGSRDLFIQATGPSGLVAGVQVAGGILSVSNDSLISSQTIVRWDGTASGVGDSVDVDGLLGVTIPGVGADLTDGAIGIQLNVIDADKPFSITLDVWSDVANNGVYVLQSLTKNLVAGVNYGATFLFTDLVGANFADVGAIQFTINSTASFDLSVDLVQAVPEPGSLALAGLALAGLGMARRRKVAAK